MDFLEPGTTVIFQDEDDAWLPGSIVSASGLGEEFRGEVRAMRYKADDAMTYPITASSIDPNPHVDAILEGPADLTLLEQLTEGSLLCGLRVRHHKGDVYTEAGGALISTNPFSKKSARLYTPQMMKSYAEEEDADAGVADTVLDPSPFRVAERAYRAVCNGAGPQTICVFGESGAGKTEAAKLCLRHLSYRSKKDAEAVSVVDASGGIEERVVATNPVLEAFGNAKTGRNNNSSRFGRFVQVLFEVFRGEVLPEDMDMYDAQPRVIGASITSYLLEKSRVSHQLQGERNFHIFYQFLNGSARDFLVEKYNLPLENFADGDDFASAFRILVVGDCSKIDGVDDTEEWRETVAALERLGMGAAVRQKMERVLAAILLLGNVTFEGKSVSNADEVAVASDGGEANVFLQKAAKLLGLESGVLHEALVCRKVMETQAFVSVDVAVANCGAMMKGLYASLFEWILARANVNLMDDSDTQTMSHAKMSFIGMLDIFGFESFEQNSLEQLLINYANERLQEHFLNFIFKREAEIYEADGIADLHVTYTDNAAILSLLENKNSGILTLLNETTMLRNGTDERFLAKVKADNAESVAFFVPQLTHKSTDEEVRLQAVSFGVRHYAGDVVYNVGNFVEKNKDKFPVEATDAIKSSGDMFVAGLFEIHNQDDMNKDALQSALGARESRFRSFRGGPLRDGLLTKEERSAGEKAKSRKSGATTSSREAPKLVVGKFKRSLAQLSQVLAATQPHFILCLKPNTHDLPFEHPYSFDGRHTMHQLHVLGVLHVVEARRQGFATRLPHDAFHERYVSLVPDVIVFDEKSDASENASKTNALRLVEALVMETGVPREGLRVGDTKVFLKRSAAHVLDQKLETLLGDRALKRLRLAVEGDDLRELKAALHYARDGLRLKGEGISAAERRLEEILRQMACDELEKAATGFDTDALLIALQKGSAVGLAADHSSMEKAHSRMEWLQNRANALGTLSMLLITAKSLRSVKVDKIADVGWQLDAAIKECEGYHGDEQTIFDAKTMMGKLMRRGEDSFLKDAEAVLECHDAEVNKLEMFAAQQMEGLERSDGSEGADKMRRMGTDHENNLRGAEKDAGLLQSLGVDSEPVSTKRALCQEKLKSFQETREALLKKLEEARDRKRAEAEESQKKKAVPIPVPVPVPTPQAALPVAPAALTGKAAEEDKEDLAEDSIPAEAADEADNIADDVSESSTVAGEYEDIFQDDELSAAGAKALEQNEEDDGEDVDERFLSLSLDKRIELLKKGTQVLKLTFRTLSRKRADWKHISLREEGDETFSVGAEFGANADDGKDESREALVKNSSRVSSRAFSISWDTGKQSSTIDLNSVTHVSIGPHRSKRVESHISTKNLPSWATLPTPYHFFSLHTGGRTYDFGSTSAETVILWVVTIQDLVQPRIVERASAVEFGRHFALAKAQFDYFRDLPSMRRQQGGPQSLNPLLNSLAPQVMQMAWALGLGSTEGFTFGMGTDNMLHFAVSLVEAPYPEEYKRRLDSAKLIWYNDDTGVERSRHPRNRMYKRHVQETIKALGNRPASLRRSSPRLSKTTKDGKSANAGGNMCEVDLFVAVLLGQADVLAQWTKDGGNVDMRYSGMEDWSESEEGRRHEWAKPSPGSNLLNYAATWCDVLGPEKTEGVARVLLDAGANPDMDDGHPQVWYTPLHSAIANGCIGLVEMLIAHGADVNAKTGDGRSPLHTLPLCESGIARERALEALISAGANIELREPYDMGTPLHTAAKAGTEDVVVGLLGAGANSRAENGGGLTPGEAAWRELVNLKLVIENGVGGNTSGRLLKVQVAKAAQLERCIRVLSTKSSGSSSTISASASSLG